MPVELGGALLVLPCFARKGERRDFSADLAKQFATACMAEANCCLYRATMLSLVQWKQLGEHVCRVLSLQNVYRIGWVNVVRADAVGALAIQVVVQIVVLIDNRHLLLGRDLP